MYQQLCVVFAVLIVGCLGTHICPLPSKPCRLSAVMKDVNNTVIAEISTEPCRCNGGHACPTDWSNTTHVIRRRLISSAHTTKIVLRMMFCNPIQPARECANGETALILSGSMQVPNNVDSYVCRCHGNRPLHLYRSEMRNYQTYQHYVCAGHKPICAANEPCLTDGEEGATYPCRCRRPTYCQHDWLRGNWATCQPISGHSSGQSSGQQVIL